MRFFLDEDLSDVIAAIARERGIDIVSAHEIGRKGMPDIDQLVWPAQENRAVVTRNYDDFTNLTREFAGAAQPHAGVVFVPHSLHPRNYSGIAAAIVQFNVEHPDGVPPYSIWWLRPVRR